MRYKGKIKDLNKIIISDPSYDNEVDCRYENNNLGGGNWKVSIVINDFKKEYEEGITVEGIEFFVLINREKEYCVLRDDGCYRYHSKNELKGINIGIDTASISIGANGFVDKIKSSKGDWYSQYALSTLSDGWFGSVKEGKVNDKVNFIWFDGFFDKDTELSKEDLLEYLTNQLEITELQNEILKDDLEVEM